MKGCSHANGRGGGDSLRPSRYVIMPSPLPIVHGGWGNYSFNCYRNLMPDTSSMGICPSLSRITCTTVLRRTRDIVWRYVAPA